MRDFDEFGYFYFTVNDFQNFSEDTNISSFESKDYIFNGTTWFARLEKRTYYDDLSIKMPDLSIFLCRRNKL